MCPHPEEAMLMSFYLSNADTKPTGVEPAEFLDLPAMAEHDASGVPAAAGPKEPAAPAETSAGPAAPLPGNDHRDPG
jgi:hypothetical protein